MSKELYFGNFWLFIYLGGFLGNGFFCSGENVLKIGDEFLEELLKD